MAGAGVLDLHFRESMKSNLQHEVNFLKNSGFHKTVKIFFFNETRFGGPTELSHTLNSENLCGRVAPNVFPSYS